MGKDANKSSNSAKDEKKEKGAYDGGSLQNMGGGKMMGQKSENDDEYSELMSETDVKKLESMGGVEGIAEKLGTDVERGIPDDIEDRKQKYGENRTKQRPPKPFLSFVWDALHDKTLIILGICAAVSIGLGVTVEDPSTGWIDGTAILAAVFIVVMVTSVNDFNKEKQFRKLNELREEKNVTAIRNGENKSISVYDVLVGDILELEAGATIPADGLWISGQNTAVDESPMTGESDSVKKTDEAPFMLSGCMVVEGVCKMMVIAVGERSQKGKISALLDSPNEDTPLTEKLEKLSERIGKFGLIAAALTFSVLVGKYFIWERHGKWQWSELGNLVGYLITAVTIVVVAVPEGLPLAVTISLAYSMRKMMKDNNLVRHLEACETMGGATNICSDKTGTLTENRMTLDKLWIAGEEHEDAGEIEENVARLFAEGISVNSSAYIERGGKGKKAEKDTKGKASNDNSKAQPKPQYARVDDNKDKKKGNETAPAGDDNKPEFVGSKTECALLEYTDSKMKVSYEEIRKKHKKNIVKLYPFSSERKSMSTVIRFDSSIDAPGAEGEPSYRLYCKGASEIVSKMCSQMTTKDGKAENLDDKAAEDLKKLIEEYASSGLRTIALAYKDISEEHDWEDDSIISDLTLIGIAGIKDPVRKEVPDAVKKCKKAGIMVRMITGDNILTARHIAKECGILTEDGMAIEGPELRKMSQAELDKIIPKLQVVARSSPTDKFTLVHRLRELGEVVAVTGDGVNDAPQLKEADVGFSMGITGTEVAKEASDIVLLDDNFSSIVKAVMWGRNVYDSIRKFVQFQLTVNTVAVAIAFIGAVTKGDSPLTPVQLLWVNLIMDTFAALALATEAPTEELLKRKPYGRYDSLITRNMWRNIIGHAIYQLAVLLFLLYAINMLPIFGLPNNMKKFTEADKTIQNTIIFNSFVMCQIFNEINSRKLGSELNVFKGIFTNYVFLAVLGFTVVMQFVLAQFAGAFAGTHPLSIQQWGVCIFIGFIELPYGLLLRLVFRFKEPEHQEKHTHPLEAGQSATESSSTPATLQGEREREKSGDQRREKGKEKVKEEHVSINMPDEARSKRGDERVPLLRQSGDTNARARENWGKAQGVVTEVGVVNVLRGAGRRKSVASGAYPTRKFDARRQSTLGENFLRRSQGPNM